MKIDQIVNLQRYPLDQLDSAEGYALVESCRQKLEQTGSCLLPEFISQAALKEAHRDGLEKLSSAHQVDYEFAYDDVNDDTLATPLESLPADHPRHYKSLTRIRFLARDLMQKNNPARLLHTWPCMIEFISRVMQEPTFPSGCPLSSCILTTAEEGELQDWHFDGNDYIVTLMLEKPDRGGAFEYATGLRAPGEVDDYAGVSSVLKGERDRVHSLAIEPGTLTLFKGKYNLHKAAPVAEGCRRMMAILSYEQEPDKTGTERYLKLFYGRSLSDLPEDERVVRY